MGLKGKLVLLQRLSKCMHRFRAAFTIQALYVIQVQQAIPFHCSSTIQQFERHTCAPFGLLYLTGKGQEGRAL